MRPYLHTICIEPARWTSQRVSQPLLPALPVIAQNGFTELEIFEPHISGCQDLANFRRQFNAWGLTPVILSSYLDLHPAATSDKDLSKAVAHVTRLIEVMGFAKLRLFPAAKMKPCDSGGVNKFIERVGQISNLIPEVEILLETHDGSLADDPNLLVSILETSGLGNVGLLYQPTLFSARQAVVQMQIQERFVRHIHLQNRQPDLSFATLKDGVVPWKHILKMLTGSASMSIEFVPAGICSPEQFDLDATLQQARAEADYITGPAPLTEEATHTTSASRLGGGN